MWKCIFIFFQLSTFCEGNKRAGEAPVIKEHPSDLTKKRNEPATFHCAASGADDIKWYHNGALLETKSEHKNRKIHVYEGSLFFIKVTHKFDAGVYWCVASNEFGETRSNSAKLVVTSMSESFVKEPESYIQTLLGDKLELTCRPPKGHPTPSMTWKHNGTPVKNDSRRVVHVQGNLEIKRVIESDEGKYVCIATNEAGSRESHPSSLIILRKPWFEDMPQNVSAAAGSTVVFYCKAKGNPMPTVTWRPLNGKNLMSRIEASQENSVLRISHISVSDSGGYDCEAKNEAGATSIRTNLEVVVAPEIKEKPSDILTLVGNNATLMCDIVGDPQPLIAWRLPQENDNIIIGNIGSSNHYEIKNRKLSITNLQIEDTGSYTCWGISSGGAVASTSQVTIVTALPPPLIGAPPRDVNTTLGSTVTFPCDVSSDTSLATVTWSFKKAAHFPSISISSRKSKSRHQTNTLILKNIREDDAGIYKCTAESANGVVEAVAKLSITKRQSNSYEMYNISPSKNYGDSFPPTKPKIEFYNSSAVFLSWFPNSRTTSSQLTSYNIEYWTSGWQEWRIAKTDINETSVLIDNLLASRAYVFLVKSVNKEKTESFPSPWSDVVYTSAPKESVMLQEIKKIQKNLNKPSISLVSVINLSPYEVKLSWDILESQEHAIDGLVMYSVSKDSIKTETIIGVNIDTHLIKNLIPNTLYSFFIVPFTKNLEGLPSNSRTLTTLEEAPSIAPQGLFKEISESGSITLSWEPLPTAQVRGNILGYRILINHDNSSLIEETLNNSLTLPNLGLGRVYTAKVAGLTGGGVGPWSAPEVIDLSSDVNVVDNNDNGVPSVFYAPPHPAWLLYLLVPIIILLIVLTLIFLRRMKQKASHSVLDTNTLGPSLYSSTGPYTPNHQVNVMYNEQKIWRPIDSDHDSSLSSARLLRQEHLANEYAEPKIQRIGVHLDATEPYATTALITSSTPRIMRADYRTPPVRRLGRYGDDIQVNWSDLIPPPPSCPPPIEFPYSLADSGGSTSPSESSSQRRRYHTNSSQYENNTPMSEHYMRPCDDHSLETGHRMSDMASEHMYAVYNHNHSIQDNPNRCFQTFGTIEPVQSKVTQVEMYSKKAPKSNTH